MLATFSLALAKMTDQGSEMTSLPQGLKIEKPKYFTDFINTDAVNNYIFQVE